MQETTSCICYANFASFKLSSENVRLHTFYNIDANFSPILVGMEFLHSSIPILQHISEDFCVHISKSLVTRGGICWMGKMNFFQDIYLSTVLWEICLNCDIIFPFTPQACGSKAVWLCVGYAFRVCAGMRVRVWVSEHSFGQLLKNYGSISRLRPVWNHVPIENHSGDSNECH